MIRQLIPWRLPLCVFKQKYKTTPLPQKQIIIKDPSAGVQSKQCHRMRAELMAFTLNCVLCCFEGRVWRCFSPELFCCCLSDYFSLRCCFTTSFPLNTNDRAVDVWVKRSCVCPRVQECWCVHVSVGMLRYVAFIISRFS